MILQYVTQAIILCFFVSVAKNLWNVYSVVRLYGSMPTLTRRRCLRELYAMTGLGVLASLLSIITIVVMERG